MEKWQWISLALCAFGLFKEFRPSEPFVTEYLIEYKNFTKDTIVHVAYPISTYTYLSTLPLIFLITDFLRYKTIIIVEGVAFVFTYVLLIWGNGITNLMVVEVLYGVACSTEVAYHTYIYAKVDRDHYKKVTSYINAAILIGNFVAAVVSQSLVSMKWMNYHQLNYLTLASVSVALIISCFLPRVDKSIYFYRNTTTGAVDSSIEQHNESVYERLNCSQRIQRAYAILWVDFKKAYTNPYVIKWSVWWAIASAGVWQVITYVQALYETIFPYTEGNIYNAGVDAVHTILSAIMALSVGYVSLPWRKWGEALLFVMSILQGTLLLIMSHTNSISTAYICYIIFRTLYQVMITVASAEVAQGISDDSYGLVFGLNRFISLILQSSLTFIINDQSGLKLDERTQFSIYGIYFWILGLIFGISALVSIRTYSSQNNEKDSSSPSCRSIGSADSNSIDCGAINNL